MALLTHMTTPLDTDLAAVQRLFTRELASDSPFVAQLCQQLERYRGKMLRPTLVLLSGQAVGRVGHEHHVLAAVVEMVHMATLVHDDVLDQSEMRRQAPTVHRMHGNEAAVLLGDLLFSHAYRLCSSLDSQGAALLVATTSVRLCEGELRQVAARGRLDLSREEYDAIIRGKTAELIAASCELGAEWAGADRAQARALRAYGLHCGMAFQIVDDVLDVVGERRELGKDLGRDVGMGKLTLPLILHLAQADAAERHHMEALLSQAQPDLGQVRAALRRSGSIDQAMDAARSHVAEARSALAGLPPSSARDTLGLMAEFILERHA